VQHPAIPASRGRLALGLTGIRRAPFDRPESRRIAMPWWVILAARNSKIRRAKDSYRKRFLRPRDRPLAPCRVWPASGLSIPACVRKPGPIGAAAIGPISAVQRIARVRIRTSGTHDRGMRHNLPGVALPRHTIGGGVARQGKKHCQYRCYDASHFAHRSDSLD
jgi:hypothetical protein